MTKAWFGVVLLSATTFLPMAAQAGPRWRGSPEVWRGGHWVHDRHGGRLGWWWVVGPAWYFYPHPHAYYEVPRTVVVEQAPPVTVVQAPPPVYTAPVEVAQAPPAPPQEPVIYYCKATGTSYPETMTCLGGWSRMTATTPPTP